MVEELEGDDFVGGVLDGFADFRVEAVGHVYGCCSTLEDAEGFDDRGRHAVEGLVDVEVHERPVWSVRESLPKTSDESVPLCLGTPILVRLDLDLAESIAFGSVVCLFDCKETAIISIDGSQCQG